MGISGAEEGMRGEGGWEGNERRVGKRGVNGAVSPTTHVGEGCGHLCHCSQVGMPG